MPAASAAGVDRRDGAALDLDPPRVRLARRARREREARHRRDRRQRLAAEAERRDRLEVRHRRDLRRRVARDRERQVLALDAGAVVGDADALDAAAGEIDVDLRRARVERVLEQLLQRRRRPLDHLAGGDLVDQQVGQRADRAGISALQPLRPARVDAVGHRAAAPRARASRSLCMSAALCRCALDARRQLAGARSAPRLDQLARHLDVALEADVPVVDHEGLVRARRRWSARAWPSAAGRTRRSATGTSRSAAGRRTTRAARRGRRRRRASQPISGSARARHARAQRLRHQLPAEAVPDHRRAVATIASRSSAHSGATHGSASLTLIGPPIMPMPA